MRYYYYLMLDFWFGAFQLALTLLRAFLLG